MTGMDRPCFNSVRSIMKEFNSEVQDEYNGKWTEAFRERVQAVKDKLGVSLQDIGDEFGFSNSFVHGLLNGKESHKMASKHADRVLQMLEGLEVKAGIKKLTNSATPANAAEMTVEEMIKALHNKGFTVELKPLKG